jgi:hypothetical protein
MKDHVLAVHNISDRIAIGAIDICQSPVAEQEQERN